MLLFMAHSCLRSIFSLIQIIASECYYKSKGFIKYFFWGVLFNIEWSIFILRSNFTLIVKVLGTRTVFFKVLNYYYLSLLFNYYIIRFYHSHIYFSIQWHQWSIFPMLAGVENIICKTFQKLFKAKKFCKLLNVNFSVCICVSIFIQNIVI